jgi:hypothetical protein
MRRCFSGCFLVGGGLVRLCAVRDQRVDSLFCPLGLTWGALVIRQAFEVALVVRLTLGSRIYRVFLKSHNRTDSATGMMAERGLG